MKLDRNITDPKRGKYALIKLRDGVLMVSRSEVKADGVFTPRVYEVPAEMIDFGDTPDTDFFVIRLKDKYACEALLAYALAAEQDDPEYATEIRALAWAADHHPNKKNPD